MVGSSILPVALHKNKLYFLFGKETTLDTAPGFSDFGGGVEKGEELIETAYREGAEELTGFLGNKDELRTLIQKNGGYYRISHFFNTPSSDPTNVGSQNAYHVHIFKMNYDELLPVYYNQNHKFLWNKLDKSFLQSTKLFEKIEIQWFSVKELKLRRNEFRKFYQEVVDILCKNENNIKKFIRKGAKSTTRKKY